MPTDDLILRHGDAWSRATAHPFLRAVRDGTLPPAAFDAWLVQDHHFAGDLLGFQARLLARAPRPAQAVLAGGLVALVEELAWFEDAAARRGLRLGGDRRPATRAYAELLDRLDAAPVTEALVGLWVIERAYLDAWSSAAPGAPAYRTFVAHWTTVEFADYVARLQDAADAATEEAEPGSGDGFAAVFTAVAEAEYAFWGMALSGNGTGADNAARGIR